MLDIINATWNPVVGCLHNCSYCWARRLAETKLKNVERYRDGFKPKLVEARALRRGNEYEALLWAVELESFNPKMVWNRLRVIASEDVGLADPYAPLLIDVLEKEYDYLKGKGDDSYRLFLTHAVLFLARSPKSRIVDDLLVVVYGEIQHEDKKLTIPDYALDMHTLEGKKKGRGWDHFFSEGTKLKKEPFKNPYTERSKEILTKYGCLKSDSRKSTRIESEKLQPAITEYA